MSADSTGPAVEVEVENMAAAAQAKGYYTVAHPDLIHSMDMVWAGTERSLRAHATHHILKHYDHMIPTEEWEIGPGPVWT